MLISQALKVFLNHEFNIKDLGYLTYFLGMKWLGDVKVNYYISRNRLIIVALSFLSWVNIYLQKYVLDFLCHSGI